jgi:hypothetical protein
VAPFFVQVLALQYGARNFRLVRGEIEEDNWEWAILWKVRVEFPDVYDKDRLIWICLYDDNLIAPPGACVESGWSES